MITIGAGRISHRTCQIAWASHATIGRRRVVRGRRIGHVATVWMVHRLLAEVWGILLVMRLLIVIAVVVLVIVRSATSPARCTWASNNTSTSSSSSASSSSSRPRAHLTSSLHALPSRQMPSIVHHAGLGFVEVRWLITDVMATAFRASYGRQGTYNCVASATKLGPVRG